MAAIESGGRPYALVTPRCALAHARLLTRFSSSSAVVRLGALALSDDSAARRRLHRRTQSEFIYDLTAPKGHLPLTNAIRGTTLFKYLMKHPVWATDWEREI